MEKPTQTLNVGDDPCLDPAYPSTATPVTSSGSVLANMGISGNGGGRLVHSDQRFFKVWAAEALLSDDLDDLTDHERTVWLFAMCIASTEEPRWTAQISPKTARKCKSTPPKFMAALRHMEALGMVKIDGDSFSFIHAHRWNEGTFGKPPSAEAEATRARKAAQRERDRLRDAERDQGVTGRDMSQGVTRDSHDHKEEEKEKEEEQEEEKDLPRKRAPSSRKNSLTPEFLAKVQGEEPELDIPAFAADYLNWTGAKGHDDKQQGFRNQLRIQWKRDQFTRRSTVAASEPYVYRPRMSPFVE